MRREDFFEALAHRYNGIEVDPACDKAKERAKIEADTAAFLAAGGKVETLDPLAYGYEFDGFNYRLNFAGSTPKEN